MDISVYIEQCRKHHPDIRPFQEEDDIEWWNQGLDCIKAGDLDVAEETFKKLLLAQPDHSDGFNGLGLVYEKRKNWAKAEMFLREAINKAEEMVKDGDMDAEVADIIRADLNRVLKQEPQ